MQHLFCPPSQQPRGLLRLLQQKLGPPEEQLFHCGPRLHAVFPFSLSNNPTHKQGSVGKHI